MSGGVGRRHSSDPLLLWLWCRLAAVALIQPLVWEIPYAASGPLKKKTAKKIKIKSVCFFGFLPKDYISGAKNPLIKKEHNTY